MPLIGRAQSRVMVSIISQDGTLSKKLRKVSTWQRRTAPFHPRHTAGWAHDHRGLTRRVSAIRCSSSSASAYATGA